MAKTKILVVDDEPVVCEVTKNFLNKRGYDIFTAFTKEEAKSLIKEKRPQIILLDIRLKEESGLDILKDVKEFDKNIKVIMVTAFGEEENIRKSKSLGADDYITKPFTIDYLEKTVLEKISLLTLKKKQCKRK